MTRKLKLLDREILKAFAVDIFAAMVGMAVFGLPVLFMHGLAA